MARTPAELGQSGLPIFAGRLSLEINTRLRWPQAGLIYRGMLNDDPVSASLWTAVRTLLRTDMQVSGPHQQSVELVQSALDDMRDPLGTKLKQLASSFFYGFDIHELVYKRRPDGLVGWADWAIRRQESFYRWETDKNGRVSAFTQRPAPTYELITIPLKKCIHIIADDSDGSPEGRGALRPIYRAWYMVSQFELLAGIGLERGVGFPVISRTDNPAIALTPQQEQDIASQAEAIRQHEQMYIILPPGMDFTFAAMPGVDANSYLNFIQAFRTWMLTTAMAEFIALGTGESGGSRALAMPKIDLFLKALTGFQDKLCATINRQAIPQLMRYNGWMDKDLYPEVSLPAVKDYDLNAIGAFVSALTNAGAFHPTPEDEAWFRKISDLVDIPDDELEPMYMKLCPSCGAQVLQGMSICPDCGASMTPAPIMQQPGQQPGQPTDPNADPTMATDTTGDQADEPPVEDAPPEDTAKLSSPAPMDVDAVITEEMDAARAWAKQVMADG
jgi:hypothetical protein